MTNSPHAGTKDNMTTTPESLSTRLRAAADDIQFQARPDPHDDKALLREAATAVEHLVGRVLENFTGAGDPHKLAEDARIVAANVRQALDLGDAMTLRPFALNAALLLVVIAKKLEPVREDRAREMCAEDFGDSPADRARLSLERLGPTIGGMGATIKLHAAVGIGPACGLGIDEFRPLLAAWNADGDPWTDEALERTLVDRYDQPDGEGPTRESSVRYLPLSKMKIEGVGGFTDPASGQWIESSTVGGAVPGSRPGVLETIIDDGGAKQREFFRDLQDIGADAGPFSDKPEQDPAARLEPKTEDATPTLAELMEMSRAMLLAAQVAATESRRALDAVTAKVRQSGHGDVVAFKMVGPLPPGEDPAKTAAAIKLVLDKTGRGLRPPVGPPLKASEELRRDFQATAYKLMQRGMDDRSPPMLAEARMWFSLAANA